MRIIAFLIGLLLTQLSWCQASPIKSAELQFSARDVRAEFKQLYQQLQESHFDLYARRPKAEFDALYQHMRKAYDHPMKLSELQLSFQRFVAFGRVAHARIDEAGLAYEAFRANGGKALPLHIRVHKGRTYVVRNLSGNKRIGAGDQLISLNGKDLGSLLPLLGHTISADTDYLRDTMMEHQFPRLVWQEWGAKQRFKVRIGKADGQQLQTEVQAISRSQAEAALMQQPDQFELSWDKREARMIEKFKLDVLPKQNKVAYLRPGPFYNNTQGATDPWDNRDFVRFIDGAFRSFNQAGAKQLLIDLRDNPGGDNSFSDVMLAWFADKPFKFCSAFRIKHSQAAVASNAKRLPESEAGSISHQFAAAYAAHQRGAQFDFDIPLTAPRKKERFVGKVYLLINRHSYSNTVNVAALAQDYGFARILGEETADLATTYGAMEQFTLPRTGITVGFPKAQIVRPSGDLAARGVTPDIVIETPILATDQDLVLERALELVRDQSSR